MLILYINHDDHDVHNSNEETWTLKKYKDDPALLNTKKVNYWIVKYGWKCNGSGEARSSINIYTSKDQAVKGAYELALDVFSPFEYDGFDFNNEGHYVEISWGIKIILCVPLILPQSGKSTSIDINLNRYWRGD